MAPLSASDSPGGALRVRIAGHCPAEASMDEAPWRAGSSAGQPERRPRIGGPRARRRAGRARECPWQQPRPVPVAAASPGRAAWEAAGAGQLAGPGATAGPGRPARTFCGQRCPGRPERGAPRGQLGVILLDWYCPATPKGPLAALDGPSPGPSGLGPTWHNLVCLGFLSSVG